MYVGGGLDISVDRIVKGSDHHGKRVRTMFLSEVMKS